MARTEIKGMKELERALKRLGKVQQGPVTKAARAGARIALKAAKANAPVDTGELKGGIILKGEKNRARGKKVYDVMMDPAKNDIFVEVSKAGKRSYYPASQEYGYITKDGNYVPGYRYLRRAATENAAVIERKMIDIMSDEIDKAWKG